MINIESQITQRQFSDLIGVSESAVSGMVKNAVIISGQSAGAWLLGYCAHLREQAAGRAALGDLDLATERAGLAKAQRERIEMQNAVTRNELAPRILIEEALIRSSSKIAGIFDAIPGMIRRRVPALELEHIELIAAEIAKARNIIATMTLDDLDDDMDATEEAPEEAIGQ